MNETTSSLAPFPAVTPTDHRLFMWIAIIVCMGISLLGLCFRLCTRSRRYGLDDLAIVLCFIFVIAHGSVLIAALNIGFGVTLTPDTKPGILRAAKLVFAARPLLSSALCASKCSAILLLHRLVPKKTWRAWVCDAALCLTIVWAIASILTITIDCSPSYSTQSTNESCPGIQARISTSIALNLASELSIFGLAITCFRAFDMTTRQKFNVLASYSLRSSMIALSILYLIAHLQFLHPRNTSASMIPITTLAVCLSATSLLCPVATSVFPFPLPASPPSSIELKKSQKQRRLSTPMSFLPDRMRGDRGVFKHRARVFAGQEEGEGRESTEGIVREETFVITTKRYSEGASTFLDV